MSISLCFSNFWIDNISCPYWSFYIDILKHSNVSVKLQHKKIDNLAIKYKIKARLVEEVPLPPGCGVVAWATAFKFKLIESNLDSSNQEIIIIFKCSGDYEKGFFKTKDVYSGEIATNSGVSFGYSLDNKYEKGNLATFWNRIIIRTKI